MAITCARCGGPTQPVRIDENTTTYRCVDEACRPPRLFSLVADAGGEAE